EDRSNKRKDKNHDRRDQRLAPRRPCHLGRLGPYLLKEGEWIGCLRRHLPLIFFCGPAHGTYPGTVPLYRTILPPPPCVGQISEPRNESMKVLRPCNSGA